MRQYYCDYCGKLLNGEDCRFYSLKFYNNFSINGSLFHDFDFCAECSEKFKADYKDFIGKYVG